MLINLRNTEAVRNRPPREEVEPIALELIRRHGAHIMSTARRYAATPEDAEDAYQRGLEILLTKAPSTSAEVLVPWLKTVVKHEAYALHRQRERSGPPGDPPCETHLPDTHEQLEQRERLQVGAEALGRLKPHETRCILLLAEGHTYKQIQEITGFSYTKVNRCLTEGRRSFLERVERIESGAECERLRPLLSAFADGEASARDVALLRPHLRTCLSCRAALRGAREVPARVAALAPVGLIAGGHAGGLGALLRSAHGWLHERATALALRGQDAIEAASAHKLAAVAASAAALGGGGVATVEVTRSHAPHHQPPVAAQAPVAAPAWRPAAVVKPAAPAPSPRPREHGRHRLPARTAVAPSTPAAPPAPAAEPAATLPPPPAAASRTAKPDRASGSNSATGEFGP